MGLKGRRVSGPTKVHLCSCCTEQNGCPASHPLLPLEASYWQDLTDFNWQGSCTRQLFRLPASMEKEALRRAGVAEQQSSAPLGCGTGVSLCPDVTVQTWRSTRSVSHSKGPGEGVKDV